MRGIGETILFIIVIFLVIFTVGEMLGVWQFWSAMEFDCEKINSGRRNTDSGLIDPFAGGKTTGGW